MTLSPGLIDYSLTSLRRAPRSGGGALGLPNMGRLRSECVACLPDLDFDTASRTLIETWRDVRILFARSTDLPKLLVTGQVDAIVTGFDYVREANVEDQVDTHADLGFQRTRISVIGPGTSRGWATKEELRVVSQYPGVARRTLDRLGRQDVVVTAIDGAAEGYLRLGLADVAVDAVMTGETLAANGLEELEPLFESSGRVFTRAPIPAGTNMREAVDRIVAAAQELVGTSSR